MQGLSAREHPYSMRSEIALLPAFTSTISGIADVILGRSCAGCDEPGIALCPVCRQLLAPRPRLRRSLDMDEISAGLHLPVACSLDYRGEVRQVLYRYKDHRIPELAGALGPALAASIEFAAEHASTSTSELTAAIIPTRRSTAKRRGFDTVAALTRAATAHRPVAATCTPLADVRRDGHVKSLGVWERQHRTAGAFAIRGPIPSGPVILIDDIVTTGATAREAAASLMVAGVHVVAVAAVAGTP